MQQEQRKQLIVKEKFQNEVILQSTLITFIVLNVVIISWYLITNMYGQLPNAQITFSLVIAVLELIGIAIVYRYSKKMSFRVAGPLYAIEKKLMLIAGGDLSQEVRLRKNDYFHEVGDTVNEVVAAYQARIGRLKEVADELNSENSAERHRELARTLQAELEYFTLELRQDSSPDQES